MSPVLHLNPDTLFQIPSTTNVIAVTGSAKTVYVSAQAALDADGMLVGDNDIAAQATQVMKNVEAGLAAAGAELRHIVRWNVYLVSGQPFGPAFEAFLTYWNNRAELPTATLLFVAALAEPDFLIEMDAIAVVPE